MQSRPVDAGGVVVVTPDHPWPPTTGGRRRAASIADALGSIGPLTLLSLDAAEVPTGWADATARHRARRSSTRVRAFDVAASVLRGNHVVLQRGIAAGLPSAFETVLLDRRPSVVVLGRPFVGPFVEIARRHHARVVIEADE